MGWMSTKCIAHHHAATISDTQTSIQFEYFSENLLLR